jgi:hypothetical protein
MIHSKDKVSETNKNFTKESFKDLKSKINLNLNLSNLRFQHLYFIYIYIRKNY